MSLFYLRNLKPSDTKRKAIKEPRLEQDEEGHPYYASAR